jgi:thioester reductase-like protein
MNHLETYSMAKAATVGGAREVLKLAVDKKLKLINCISTLSVFSQLDGEANRVVWERSAIDEEKHLTSEGYPASKWVAEQMFRQASDLGVPCNIFRLGLVWADSLRGRYDELQREYRILKSSLLAGVGIRNYRCGMPPTPVDYVARAVCHLASVHREGQGIFHISASEQRIDGLFERCNQIAGVSMDLLPAYEWILQLKRIHYEGGWVPVAPLIEFTFSMDEESYYEYVRRHEAKKTNFSCAKTHAELENSGIRTPVVDEQLLGLCLESMFQRDLDLRKERPREAARR